ncbi:MAG: hypothetical protein IJS45_07825 [Clostridia bacterium]|nr:hypothetical protein [Clostridia bacterium]
MKNRIFSLSALILALTFCGIACFAGLTYARTVNTYVWTGQIDSPPANSAANVTCDLLHPDGRMQILLPGEGSFDLPIVLRSVDGRMHGTLTASSDWVDVSPASTELSYDAAGSATVNLSVMLIAEREIGGELQSAPSVVSFDVEWEGEDQNGDTETISATFVINRSDEEDTENGVIVNPPQWYSPESDIVIYLDSGATIMLNKSEESDGKFPANTRYETDGVTTVLYSENYIRVEDAGVVIINLSNTDVDGEIKLSTTMGDCILTEVDNITSGIGGRPLVVGDEGASLLIPYTWANITPTFAAWKMVKSGGTTTWSTTNLVVCAPDDGGDAYVTAANAPAGTYKLLIEWNYNGHTLYSEEIYFFVRHNSCGQGGITR